MTITTQPLDGLDVPTCSVASRTRADGPLTRLGRAFMKQIRDAAWTILDLGTEIEPLEPIEP